jgi:serine/threonine protein kinase/Tfp pilus assembly protein PilF
MTEPLDDNQVKAIEEAVRKFVEARWRGQEPDVEAFVNQYPGLEHRLRQDIQAMQKIDILFDSLVQADDADFAEAEAGQDLVGQRVGGLEVKEMIGSGGMGVVYLAHDSKLDRSVAVKSMPAKLAQDATARMRFLREAKLLASLNHPNIAVIHDIIEQDDDTSYLVLEYIPGDTLAQRIARDALPMEQALSIAQQIAEAVAAAHDKGVVHRDLKPGNIKITPDNRIKVLDFGLAKASDSPGRNSQITVTEPGRIMGTPAYMSPEQARGRATDSRTDIWSFGCILYEMLTGRLPFAGETATDTLARIIEREPDWELLPRNTPTNIRNLLRRCLDKDPTQRVQHIADARKDINAALSDSTSTTAPTTPLKPRKTVVVLGATVIIVLIVAMWFSLGKDTQSSSKKIPLVVLPFDSQGPALDEYFVDGITDEMITRLAGIHGLDVTSPYSSMLYKDKEKNVGQIRKKLKVDYILGGTIRYERPSDPSGEVKLIIRAHLIKTLDDTVLWSKPYERDKKNVFQAYTEIAKQVIQELDIPLTEPEQRALGYFPTKNIQAYKYFLQGNKYYYLGMVENNAEIAIKGYQEAVKLDPEFTLAHARLSIAHIRTYCWWDHSDEHLNGAKEAMERALALDPDLPEAHEAWGWYRYYGEGNSDDALTHFKVALEKQPSNSGILEGMGYVYRRLGKLDDALGNLKAAYKLNPSYPMLPTQVGITLARMGKHSQAEAEDYLNQAILMAPDQSLAYQHKASLCLRQGNIAKARDVLKKASDKVEDRENRADLDWHVVFVEMCDDNYQVALDRLFSHSEARDDMASFTPRDLQRAEIYRLWGKDELANKHYGSALGIIQDKINEEPEDDRSCLYYSSLGLAYAGLGRKQDAIKAHQRSIALDQKYHPGASSKVKDLARIYATLGDLNAAIDQIEILLERPPGLSIPLLRIDPAWKPLRDHPRFKQLLAKK